MKKKLKKAIKSIAKECKKNKKCYSCPFWNSKNTSRICGNVLPEGWPKALKKEDK